MKSSFECEALVEMVQRYALEHNLGVLLIATPPDPVKGDEAALLIEGVSSPSCERLTACALASQEDPVGMIGVALIEKKADFQRPLKA